MMAFKSTIDGCWSGIFTMETDHDRVPIVAGRKVMRAPTMVALEALCLFDSGFLPLKRILPIIRRM